MAWLRQQNAALPQRGLAKSNVLPACIFLKKMAWLRQQNAALPPTDKKTDKPNTTPHPSSQCKMAWLRQQNPYLKLQARLLRHSASTHLPHLVKLQCLIVQVNSTMDQA